MPGTQEWVWSSKLIDPSTHRESKPRIHGKTMVIDKGLGWNGFEDLLETAGPYIDYVKIGFGTAVLYPLPLLKRKIALAREYDVTILPGGTFFEIALHQQAITEFFDMILFLGFTGIEISDGTLALDRRKRNEMILHGLEEGLHVLTEFGKKNKDIPMDHHEFAETCDADLYYGAELVTIEARESGLGIGVFDQHGLCRDDEVEHMLARLPPHQRHQLLWEAPLLSQQVQLLHLLGNCVHLGNIAAQDVISLEALRRGLRSDTFESFAMNAHERENPCSSK